MLQCVCLFSLCATLLLVYNYSNSLPYAHALERCCLDGSCASVFRIKSWSCDSFSMYAIWYVLNHTQTGIVLNCLLILSPPGSPRRQMCCWPCIDMFLPDTWFQTGFKVACFGSCGHQEMQTPSQCLMVCADLLCSLLNCHVS